MASELLVNAIVFGLAYGHKAAMKKLVTLASTSTLVKLSSMDSTAILVKSVEQAEENDAKKRLMKAEMERRGRGSRKKV